MSDEDDSTITSTIKSEKPPSPKRAPPTAGQEPKELDEEPYTRRLIKLAISHDILRFGTFTLKSGRQSPYFYNAGLFDTGLLLNAIGLAYAAKIAALGPALQFDVLFGPAYKGIPLAAVTAVELARLDPLAYSAVGVAYNRKETKAHGEQGTLVGAPLAGKRVLILDDVITAGTAIREALDIIATAQGTCIGAVVGLDRQEKADDSELSAVEIVESQFGLKVHPVFKLTDIIQLMRDSGGYEAELEQMETYRKTWGISRIQN